MKYAIYARVSPKGSSWDASETTIEMQINMCREFATVRGGEVVEIVQDEFVSGKDLNRPGFQKIVNELKSGKAEWDVLICYKLSRMTRSQQDAVNLFAELFKQGKGFVSVTENFDYSTPAGRAMLGIMQIFNQFEREQTSENIRNKMIAMAAKGLWPTGKPPFGYKRGEKKDCNLYVDYRTSEIVKDIFRMYGEKNIRPSDILLKYRNVISKSKLFKLLKDKTYLGKICYAGKEFDGHHPALISQETFDRIQEMIPSSKTAPRYKAQKYTYLLAGLVKCHCGKTMSPGSAKSGRYHYYVCSDPFCKNRVKAETIENLAKETLLNFKIKDNFADRMRDELKKIQEEKISNFKPEIESVKKAYDEAVRERAKLYKKFLEVENIGESGFLNDRMNYLSKEISILEARRDVLLKQTEDAPIFALVEQDIEAIQMVKDLLKEAIENDDFATIRTVIVGNIECVKNVSGDEYQVILSESSSNGNKWWSIGNLIELFGLLKFKIA